MDEDKKLKKIIKWVGIVTLIAVPVIMYINKKKTQHPNNEWEDESDIFASELEE